MCGAEHYPTGVPEIEQAEQQRELGDVALGRDQVVDDGQLDVALLERREDAPRRVQPREAVGHLHQQHVNLGLAVTVRGDESDEQARYLEAEVEGVVIANLYLPNGKYNWSLGAREYSII